MTLWIATDEAGYGPKLGPLVIVASVWRPGDEGTIENAFESLADPIALGGLSIRVDDSKRLFKRVPVGMPSLIDVITVAASKWCGGVCPRCDLGQWLDGIAAEDCDDLRTVPWYEAIWNAADADRSQAFVDDQTSGQLIQHWGRGGLRMIGLAARVIDPGPFNRHCGAGMNKADILSESTCRLAIQQCQRHLRDGEDAVILSDRHGGRSHYGGLLQHAFPEAILRVISEDRLISRYRLDLPDSPSQIQWTFSVRGDSFAPVAMSSIVAKSTREQLMTRLNRYFADRWARSAYVSKEPLHPTAGYPADADRFLAILERMRLREGIDDDILIRKR